MFWNFIKTFITQFFYFTVLWNYVGFGYRMSIFCFFSYRSPFHLFIFRFSTDTWFLQNIESKVKFGISVRNWFCIRQHKSIVKTALRIFIKITIHDEFSNNLNNYKTSRITSYMKETINFKSVYIKISIHKNSSLMYCW